jgi:uncharacterized protein YbjT (DUF2867 family)
VRKRKSILVYLANGVQGGAVARQAVRQGYRVRALVRDPSKSADLKKPGVEIVMGDLANKASLEAAHLQIDYVILQIPAGTPPQTESFIENAAGAIKMSGVKGVVVKMGNGKPSIPSGVTAFAAGRMIEERMRASGIPFSTVRPTMYLDNMLAPALRSGIAANRTIVYPISSKQKIAWTSVDDAARISLAILENEVFGGDYRISGRDSVDGEGLASAFSEALSRTIRFQSLSLDAFEQSVGKWVSAKFRFFEQHPDEADRMLAEPFKESSELGGFRATTLQTWVNDRRSLFV